MQSERGDDIRRHCSAPSLQKSHCPGKEKSSQGPTEAVCPPAAVHPQMRRALLDPIRPRKGNVVQHAGSHRSP